MNHNNEITPLQQEILDRCMQFLFENENPAHMIKNYPLHRDSVYDAFGLSDEQQKELRQIVLENYDLSVHELADLGTILVSTHKYELELLAIQLLKKHRPRLDHYVYERVMKWLEDGLENISLVDLLATKITPVFLELGIVGVDEFESWRQSQNKWTRRVGILTMLYLKDKVSPARLLEFAQPLIKDPEKIVQQAVGIYLRELWGIYFEEVEEFLVSHKEDAAALVIQHATQKMHWEKKKRFGAAAMSKAPGGKSYDRRSKTQNRPPQKRSQNPQQPRQHPQNQNRNFKYNKPQGHSQPRFTPKPKPKPNVQVPEPEAPKHREIPDWDSFDKK